MRDSDTFPGEFTLDYWDEAILRARIRFQHGLYFLTDEISFYSLADLISFFMKNPVRSAAKQTVLKAAVPPKPLHEDKKWFHANITRHQAEAMLRAVRSDGRPPSFLSFPFLSFPCLAFFFLLCFFPSVFLIVCGRMDGRTAGAFLVRASESQPGSFAISFRAERKMKHCHVRRVGPFSSVQCSFSFLVVFFLTWQPCFLERPVGPVLLHGRQHV